MLEFLKGSFVVATESLTADEIERVKDLSRPLVSDRSVLIEARILWTRCVAMARPMWPGDPCEV